MAKTLYYIYCREESGNEFYVDIRNTRESAIDLIRTCYNRDHNLGYNSISGPRYYFMVERAGN